MLITFTSETGADVVMFGEVARQFLRIMGEPDHPPGILRGENIRHAANKLRHWLDEHSPQPLENSAVTANSNGKSDDEDDELQRQQRINAKTRALPLLELLETAFKEKEDVIWR